jgi:hypothetical protein
MEGKIRQSNLLIKLPLLRPFRRSQSGKTVVIATSRGSRRINEMIGSKPISINVIATIPAQHPEDVYAYGAYDDPNEQ